MLKLKKIFCILTFLIVFSYNCVPVYADSSCTDWNIVRINQSGVGHPSGCTTVSLQLILQNSQTLPDDYQLSGDITSATDTYTKFDKDTSSFHNGDAWKIGGFIGGASNITNAVWAISGSVAGQSVNTADYNSAIVITGLGNKDFRDMSYEEQVTAMKAFWNAGYFVVFCVEYKGVGQESNGPTGYRAAHATMLAGVDDTDIYLNDPANGKVCMYKDRSAKGGAYNLVYVILMKNDKTAPNTLSSGGNAAVTASDNQNANAIGISTNIVRGYYSQEDLSAFCKLKEINLQEMFLDGATRDRLDQESLESLAKWERNIKRNKEDYSFITVIRTIVMFMGIIMTIWVVLIYLAYWFDRLNTIFDIDALNLMTFGRLHISDDESKCSFFGRSNKKTVNHKAILYICGVALLFCFLIITGCFYEIISGFINLLLRWFHR